MAALISREPTEDATMGRTVCQATKNIRLGLILLVATLAILAAGCVQVEISGLPTEHVWVAAPGPVTELLDCTPAPSAAAIAPELHCQPVAVTVRHVLAENEH